MELLGIGTDILQRDRLLQEYLREEDPFCRKTFTEKELLEAAGEGDRKGYLSGRFCAKEAVFKALGRSSEGFVMKDIEILRGKYGQPEVSLLGEVKEKAARRDICRILLSLSYEEEWIVAYAAALGRGVSHGIGINE